MRVRVRTTAAGPWGLIGAGQVGIVPDDIGAAMVAARAAVEVAGEEPATVCDDAPAQEAVVDVPEAAVIDLTITVLR